jgi:hypothetical protein
MQAKPAATKAPIYACGRFAVAAWTLMMQVTLAQRASHVSADFDRTVSGVDDSAKLRDACDSYETLGQADKALVACSAVLRQSTATADDYAQYARLVMAGTGALSVEQIARIDEAVRRISKEMPMQSAAPELQCQLAVRLHDAGRLEACTRTLQQRDANDIRGIYYAWQLAVMRGDMPAAAGLRERAKRAGASAATLRWMGHAPHTLRSSTNGPSMWIVPFAGVVMAAALAWLMRRRRPRPHSV